MDNMDYCRFRNTLQDLRNCIEYLYDVCDDEDEEKARLKLIDLCKDISLDFEDREG